MLVAIIQNNEIVGVGSGIKGIPIPQELAMLPADRLRFDGSVIVDAANADQFYIDTDGHKQLTDTTDSQLLECSWDDELVLDAGQWRIKSDKDKLEAYAAQKRWEVEAGGTTFNGMLIPTDDRAKTLIEGAADDLADDETTSFKVDGQWLTLDGVTMRLIRTTLRNHVKECFAKEAEISVLIHSDDTNVKITTKTQIDSANWPS